MTDSKLQLEGIMACHNLQTAPGREDFGGRSIPVSFSSVKTKPTQTTYMCDNFLTLTVLVRTIDALGHFKTG